MELETLNIYIETTLANGFIKLSKCLASAFMLYIWKLDSSH